MSSSSSSSAAVAPAAAAAVSSLNASMDSLHVQQRAAAPAASPAAVAAENKCFPSFNKSTVDLTGYAKEGAYNLKNYFRKKYGGECESLASRVLMRPYA